MNASVLGGMLVLCGVLAACSSSDDGSEPTGSGGAGGSSGNGGDNGSGGNGPGNSSSNSGSVGNSTATTSTGGGGEGICGTTSSFDEGGPVDTCVEGGCCGEFTACVAVDGSTAEACNSCLMDGGGALCDPFITCTDNEGCFGGGGGICDSGLSVGDAALDACLSEACCDEANACTANNTNVEACLDCLQAGGGGLCDDLNGCVNNSGCL